MSSAKGSSPSSAKAADPTVPLKAQIKQQHERIVELERLVVQTREQMQALYQMDLDDLRARLAACQEEYQALRQNTPKTQRKPARKTGASKK